MKTSTQYTNKHSCAILLVGEPKTGKTRTMLAFPDPWIADIDLNLNSGLRVAPGKKFWFDQPSLNDDGTERPAEKRWDTLVEATKIAIRTPEVKSIVIDGLGILSGYLIAHVVASAVKAGNCKTGKMELQMYGEFARLLRGYVMMVRASGRYIVFTSHQTVDKNELTGALHYALAIPGQSKDTLGGLFTDVWATTATPAGIGKVKYEIRTKPTGFHVALGTSFDLSPAIDVTDKSPSEIWSLLAPKIGVTSQPTTTK